MQDWKGKTQGQDEPGTAPEILVSYSFPSQLSPTGSQAEGQADADGGVASGV